MHPVFAHLSHRAMIVTYGLNEIRLQGLFWTSVFFFGSCTPSEKYLGPKQSPPISHNDLKKDGAQLLLSKCGLDRAITQVINVYITCTKILVLRLVDSRSLF